MEQVIQEARQAKELAYAPYSNYRVGAAIRTTNGSIFSGLNIEFVNYSNTIHAEEAALVAAITEGFDEFDMMAISTTTQVGAPPCGMCRQSLAEFCGEDFIILADKGEGYSEYRLGELLPNAMVPDDLLSSGKRPKG